jgi:CRISPR system Cascade subunit CasE
MHRQAHPTVLVQSVSEPDWNLLPKGYSFPIQSNSFSLEFIQGQSFQFRLVANPTKKEKREGRKQGRRQALPDFQPLQTENDELTPAQAWLRRKGEQHGFEILWAISEAFWLGPGVNESVAQKQSLPLYGVRFEGILRVIEPEKFILGIREGIGSAKAFGFGLLSLARHK